MRYAKYFAGFALAAGMLATTASAQDWRYQQQGQYQYQNQYPNQDYVRNSGNYYDQAEELQEHIARDHAKLNEAIRCGNDAEAARQAADLARDQRALRDMQYQQNTRYYNNRRYYNRGGWGFSYTWR